MARKPTKLPDYCTPEEARALVAAAPSYAVRFTSFSPARRLSAVPKPRFPGQGGCPGLTVRI